MRTTLVIEDDVLEAVRRLAEAEGKSLGQVISMLARRGLAPQRPERIGESFPVFSVSPKAKPLTMELVRQGDFAAKMHFMLLVQWKLAASTS